ncbi:MAG TPA: carboxypeptidase-like regulatory domain-containing protein, partial [Planctomycetaceae bacterium]|nr:carboxypeptidase-like regulatory domain-containing protein [Planctomycetaceae bacterium]
MKFGQKTRGAFVGIVSWGLLLQQTPTFANPPAADTAATATWNETKPSEFKPAPRKAPPPAAIDVALAKNGVAFGRVLDADQKGIANARVSFRQGKDEIAQVTTDQEGRFAIQNLKGGVYLITSSSGYGLFRFWAPKSAPPAAREQVLLRSNAVIVRAQNQDDSGDVLYDENGQPY